MAFGVHCISSHVVLKKYIQIYSVLNVDAQELRAFKDARQERGTPMNNTLGQIMMTKVEPVDVTKVYVGLCEALACYLIGKGHLVSNPTQHRYGMVIL